jgi:hypothetical protein
MLPWILTLAIRRVGKPHHWRGVFCGRPFIANIGPEATSPGLSVAGSEHRNRRVIAWILLANKTGLPSASTSGREQLAGGSHPTYHRGAIKVYALASIYLGLAIHTEGSDRHILQRAHAPAVPVRRGHGRWCAVEQALRQRARTGCRRTSAAHGEGP